MQSPPIRMHAWAIQGVLSFYLGKRAMGVTTFSWASCRSVSVVPMRTFQGYTPASATSGGGLKKPSARRLSMTVPTLIA